MISKKANNQSKDSILFLHGAWHGQWCWEKYYMDYFASQGYDTYAFNLRMHDKPGKVKGINKVSIHDYVTDLEKAVAKIDGDPIILAHSMGGLVLQKYLEKQSCKKAILMTPVPPSGVLRITLKLLFTKLYALPSMLSLNLYGIVNSRTKAIWSFLSENADQDIVDYCNQNLCSESYLAFLNMLYPNIKVNFHTKIPMLVIGAENDNIFTVNENKKTAEKYNADLVILPDTAHDMMLDYNYKESADTIINWIENV